MNHQPIKLASGRYTLATFVGGRTTMLQEDGVVWSAKTLQGALRKLQSISGNPLLKVSTEGELDALFAACNTSSPMRGALRDLLLHGKTWKLASRQNGVSQAGMLMALRRISNRKPQEESNDQS